MKTRFSSLVTIKKSKMQKSEQVVQSANADLNSAAMALELSRNALNDLDSPTSGFMAGFLASRTLLDASRSLIKHNQEWVSFAKSQVTIAKNQLKLDMVEYEKFNYLDFEEIKKMIKEREYKVAKELDEIALMTHMRNKNTRVSS